jgi:cell wall-associated NlpC family hydrolase
VNPTYLATQRSCALHAAVDIARSYIGVPFYHAGRDRNGLDCIGLIAVVASGLGYKFKDDRNYKPGIYPARMFNGMSQFAERVEDIRVGDILVFSHKGHPMHCAIYAGDDHIIHCDARRFINKVVEHSLGRYIKKLDSIWRWK